MPSRKLPGPGRTVTRVPGQALTGPGTRVCRPDPAWAGRGSASRCVVDPAPGGQRHSCPGLVPPTGSRLAEVYGVSRLAVREALQLLASVAWLRAARQGHGGPGRERLGRTVRAGNGRARSGWARRDAPARPLRRAADPGVRRGRDGGAVGQRSSAEGDRRQGQHARRRSGEQAIAADQFWRPTATSTTCSLRPPETRRCARSSGRYTSTSVRAGPRSASGLPSGWRAPGSTRRSPTRSWLVTRRRHAPRWKPTSTTPNGNRPSTTNPRGSTGPVCAGSSARLRSC